MASRAPDGTGGPPAFVADLHSPVLGADDRHHLERVLRLRAGDPLTICDGEGRWRDCRFDKDLEVVGEVFDVPAPNGEVTVGFSMLKAGRPELVVQKLTELGVDRILPLLAERSIVRWDADKCATQHQRFLRVAREAAMQSRRVRLPVVEAITQAHLGGQLGAMIIRFADVLALVKERKMNVLHHVELLDEIVGLEDCLLYTSDAADDTPV